jgi:hypothetical protein
MKIRQHSDIIRILATPLYSQVHQLIHISAGHGTAGQSDLAHTLHIIRFACLQKSGFARQPKLRENRVCTCARIWRGLQGGRATDFVWLAELETGMNRTTNADRITAVESRRNQLRVPFGSSKTTATREQLWSKDTRTAFLFTRMGSQWAGVNME